MQLKQLSHKIRCPCCKRIIHKQDQYRYVILLYDDTYLVCYTCAMKLSYDNVLQYIADTHTVWIEKKDTQVMCYYQDVSICSLLKRSGIKEIC